MLTRLVIFVRSVALICAGHLAVALENVALRHVTSLVSLDFFTVPTVTGRVLLLRLITVGGSAISGSPSIPPPPGRPRGLPQ